MPLTRKLSDLYAKGTEVTIDDGQGEPVRLYVRKIMPIDAEEAYRGANKARAEAMTLKTDADSPIFQVIKDRCQMATKEEMVSQLVELELQRKRPVIEAELEYADEWSKDEYLQGLYDAWEGELKEQHFTEPTEETERVKSELDRFDAELQKRLEREREKIEADISTLTREQVEDRYFDAQFQRQAEVAWLTEYRRQELYHAVRDPDDHSVRVFESPKEIEAMAPELIRQLREAYTALGVDVVEGKD